MKKYHVFYNEHTHDARIIKYGFNIFAFLFDAFYFLYKRAWKSALMWFAGGVFIAVVGEVLLHLPPLAFAAIRTAYNVYCGFEAADCLVGETRLNKDFEDYGVVFAESEEAALISALRKAEYL